MGKGRGGNFSSIGYSTRSSTMGFVPEINYLVSCIYCILCQNAILPSIWYPTCFFISFQIKTVD